MSGDFLLQERYIESWWPAFRIPAYFAHSWKSVQYEEACARPRDWHLPPRSLTASIFTQRSRTSTSLHGYLCEKNKTTLNIYNCRFHCLIDTVLSIFVLLCRIQPNVPDLFSSCGQ
jgi:hypothetical protein